MSNGDKQKKRAELRDIRKRAERRTANEAVRTGEFDTSGLEDLTLVNDVSINDQEVASEETVAEFVEALPSSLTYSPFLAQLTDVKSSQ